MSWDAGAITGSLRLNINEYATGMLEAESIARFFPQIVVDFMEEPILAFGDVVKETFKSVWEAMEGTAARFHQVGLAAANLGVSTEFISTVGQVAKASGLGIDELSLSLKFLQQRAADALSGEQGAAKGFADIGVKANELSGLLKDPEQLFYRVAQGIASIENPALRAQAATDLMSRAGYRMIALLGQGPDAIRNLAKEMADLGAGVTGDEAEMGEKWGMLETKFDAAWSGIKKAIGEPILDGILAHSDELNEILKDTVAIVKDIAAVVTPLIQYAMSGLTNVLAGLRYVLDGAKELFGQAAEAVSPGGETSGQSGGTGSSGGGSGGGVRIDKVEIHGVDAHEASSQIAAKIQPQIRNALLNQYRQLSAATQHGQVARAVGGRGGHYQPG